MATVDPPEVEEEIPPVVRGLRKEEEDDEEEEGFWEDCETELKVEVFEVFGTGVSVGIQGLPSASAKSYRQTKEKGMSD